MQPIIDDLDRDLRAILAKSRRKHGSVAARAVTAALISAMALGAVGYEAVRYFEPARHDRRPAPIAALAVPAQPSPTFAMERDDARSNPVAFSATPRAATSRPAERAARSNRPVKPERARRTFERQLYADNSVSPAASRPHRVTAWENTSDRERTYDQPTDENGAERNVRLATLDSIRFLRLR